MKGTTFKSKKVRLKKKSDGGNEAEAPFCWKCEFEDQKMQLEDSSDFLDF